MTTLAIGSALYIDGDNPGGLNATLNAKLSSPPSVSFVLMAGDNFPLDIYFRRRDASNGASTALELPVGAAIVVAGRTSSGSVLFGQTAFVKTGSTDDVRYVGTIDLTGAAVTAALTSVAYGSAIDISIDIAVSDPAAASQITYRAPARLYKPVYQGTMGQAAINLLTPSGYLWSITIDDNGDMSNTRLADPDPLVPGESYFEMITPSGYIWRFTMDDNGQLSKTRIT